MKSTWSKVQSTLLKLDMFGEDVSFTLKDGNRAKNSLLGTLLSVFIFSGVIVYGAKKHDDLMSYQNTTFMESKDKGALIGKEIEFGKMSVVPYFSIYRTDTPYLPLSEKDSKLFKFKAFYTDTDFSTFPATIL